MIFDPVRRCVGNVNESPDVCVSPVQSLLGRQETSCNILGKVVSAKEALARAGAEEAQAKREASVFQAAVQCFLEVGDA
jgi:hypothetical protein